MSKTFYLFRHGQTYYSKTNIPYGENQLTAEILPETIRTIQNISEKLATFPITCAFRSELLRCAQTAQIIESKTQLHFEPDPLFNEFTESDFNVFHERMQECVDKLVSTNASHIAICTHGANIAGLKRLLLKKEFSAHDLLYYPKTGVILKISNATIEEVDCNL